MKLHFILMCFTLTSLYAQGQTPKGKPAKSEIDTTSFCSVLEGFLAEAQTNFAGIKGNVTNSIGNIAEYSTNRGLPGAITSAVIDSGGTFRYEAIVYQGIYKDNMQEVYAFNIYVLAGCLQDTGYVRTNIPNTQKAVEKFPSVRYAKPNVKASTCTISVEYSDIGSIYTVTISVNK